MYVDTTDVIANVMMTTVSTSCLICPIVTPSDAMTIENSLTWARLIAGTMLVRRPRRSA